MMSPRASGTRRLPRGGPRPGGLSLPNTDPVHKVSIIPRGVGALGYTLQRPDEDRYLMTQGRAGDRIAVLARRHVAEELVFGEISTGAHNDLERATALARAMVMRYGMSERLGPLTFGGSGGSGYLRRAGAPWEGGEREYSEETARAIDEEVRRIVEETYDRVRGLLGAKKATLLQAAQVLKRRETLEGEELRRLLAGEPVPAGA